MKTPSPVHVPLDEFDSLYRVEIARDSVVEAARYLTERLGPPYDSGTFYYPLAADPEELQRLRAAAQWGGYWKYSSGHQESVSASSAIYWFRSRDEAILFRLSI